MEQNNMQIPIELNQDQPKFDSGFLNGPIPGMSLTTEPGNRPWENPPQMVTLEEAVSYYSSKLLDPENTDAIVNALDQQISLESIAEHMTTSAVMDGLHTIDISILVNPVIRELLKYVAEVNEVEYVDSYAEVAKKDKLPRAQIARIVKETIKKSKQLPPEIMEVQKKAMSMSKGEMPTETPTGLMARKTQPAMEGM